MLGYDPIIISYTDEDDERINFCPRGTCGGNGIDPSHDVPDGDVRWREGLACPEREDQDRIEAFDYEAAAATLREFRDSTGVAA